MKKEAETHASDDKKRREVIDLRNQADQLISVSEKTLKDAGDKAKAEDKAEVEEKVKALKEVKDKEDTTAIQTAMQALSDAIQKVGAAMYAEAKPERGQGTGDSEQTGAGQAEGGAGASSGDGNPTVDAEFKEKE